MNGRLAVQLVLVAAILAVLAALVMVVGLAVLFEDALRLTVGVLVVILPGLAISTALLPPGSLDASRRATVALASGVGLVGLGGLALNQLPSGLNGPAWLALIVIAIVVSIGIAVARGHISRANWVSWRRWFDAARSGGAWLAGQDGSADTDRPLSTPSAALAPGSPARTSLGRSLRPPSIPVLRVALAILMAIAALSLAKAGVAQQDQAQGFTEFSAVLGQAGPGDVRLVIISHEPSSTEYSVRVESGGRSFAEFDRINLGSGESWETTVTLPVVPGPVPTGTAPLPSGATPVPVLASLMQADLFRAGISTPYREVNLHAPAAS